MKNRKIGAFFNAHPVRFKYVKYSISQKKTAFDWEEVELAHKDAVGITFSTEPFGEGRERLAYQMFEIDKTGKKVGENLVMKKSIQEGNDEYTKFHRSFCEVQLIAENSAKRFNEHLKRLPHIPDYVPDITLLDLLPSNSKQNNREK